MVVAEVACSIYTKDTVIWEELKKERNTHTGG
jgi:hypothetical protein